MEDKKYDVTPELKNIDLDCQLPRVKYFSNYDILQEVWINLINNRL